LIGILERDFEAFASHLRPAFHTARIPIELKDDVIN
jgi:hypothetical protein